MVVGVFSSSNLRQDSGVEGQVQCQGWGTESRIRLPVELSGDSDTEVGILLL